jgi:tetratricopeptide (TPR) repeat protein
MSNSTEKRKIVLYVEDAEQKVAFEELESDTGYDTVRVLPNDPDAGVPAEYEWLDFKYPNSGIISQELTEMKIEGKQVHCDILTIELENGDIKKVCFDISRFFGVRKKSKHRTSGVYEGEEYVDVADLISKAEDIIDRFYQLEELTDQEQCVESLKKLAFDYPEIPALLVQYAELFVAILNFYDTSEQVENRIKILAALAEEHPAIPDLLDSHAGALHCLASFYKTAEKKEACIEEIRKLLLKQPDRSGLLRRYALGLNYLILSDCTNINEKEKYLETLRTLNQEHPDIPSIIIDYCISLECLYREYESKQKKQECVEAIKKLIKTHRDIKELRNYLP